MTSTIRLRREQLAKYLQLAGMTRQKQLAEAIGISEAGVYKTLEGRTGPGEKFIAGSLTAFPMLKFDDLFEVVAVEDAAA